MSIFLGILLYFGFVSSIVYLEYTDPNSSSGLTRTSYAEGTVYGCSHKFFRHHCWRYCDGSSGKWCYTADNHPNHCSDDHDCWTNTACQGWCAWNSQSGCSKACHERVEPKPEQRPRCRRGQPYWECQTDYGYGGWRSQLATGGKWISADISNEQISNRIQTTLSFNGNVATSTEKSGTQTALWYPMGEIKKTSTTFYWTFTVREMGTSSTIFVGLSDINKLAPGYGVRGLFYGGNLSDGSGLLIEKFGPKLQVGDKLSLLVKVLDGRLKTYVILNGKSLGISYDVPQQTLDGIYPVVKFSGEGVVEIEEKESTEAPAELEPVKPFILEGNWTLNTLGNGETPGIKVTMKIAEIYDRVHDKVYGLRIHALNKFMAKMTETSASNWVGEVLDQTQKKGTEDETKLEAALSKHISELKNVVLDTVRSELRLESLGGTSVWKLNVPKLSTVNWNPFEKKKN